MNRLSEKLYEFHVYVRIVCILSSTIEARVKFLKIRLRLNSAHDPYIST